jgi:hypothetical protein
MGLLRIAAASIAVGGALTASVALAQGGYPGMPGYGPPPGPYGAQPGPPGPYGAQPGPPGGMPPGYPPGMPSMGPMMPPSAAPQSSTPMVDPSQIYGSSSGSQSQPSTEPSQAYPGVAAGMPMRGPMPGMPGMPMAGPMGPSGVMPGMAAMPPGQSAVDGSSSGSQSQPSTDPSQAYPGAAAGMPMAGPMPGMPGMPMAGPMGPSGAMPGPGGMPGQPGVNAIPGVPPLANAQSPLPPGSAMGPQGMAQAQGQGTSPGPSGFASMQASPTSQAGTPSNQGGASTDTVRIVESGEGSIALDPTPIRYPVNRQITWINNTSSIIQLVTEDVTTFDSGPLAPGDTFSYTPSLIGSVYYRDKLHPWVRGVVVTIQAR